MTKTLQRWRKRNNLKQVDAAALLGVSQPYLSLLERGARPLSRKLRQRLKLVPSPTTDPTDERLRSQLRALGYPGFAHVDGERPVPSPSAVLVNALSRPTLDARIVEALPWLVLRYAAELDWGWLVPRRSCETCKTASGSSRRWLWPPAVESHRTAPCGAREMSSMHQDSRPKQLSVGMRCRRLRGSGYANMVRPRQLTGTWLRDSGRRRPSS